MFFWKKGSVYLFSAAVGFGLLFGGMPEKALSIVNLFLLVIAATVFSKSSGLFLELKGLDWKEKLMGLYFYWLPTGFAFIIANLAWYTGRISVDSVFGMTGVMLPLGSVIFYFAIAGIYEFYGDK